MTASPEILPARHPWAMYGSTRKDFEYWFQRAEGKNVPNSQGRLLWEKIQFFFPEAKLLGIGDKFVAITRQQDEQAKALLWTHVSPVTGELVITARLYHPSMGEDSLVYDCSNICTDIKELWKLIPNSETTVVDDQS